MDATNYYQYLKELEETQNEVNELEYKLESQMRAKTSSQLLKLRNEIFEKLKDIDDSCKFTVASEQKLVQVLNGTDTNCIRVDRECSQNIRSIVGAIETVFDGSEKSIPNIENFDFAKSNEFLHAMMSNEKNARQSAKACTTLFNNVQQIKRPGALTCEINRTTTTTGGRNGSSVSPECSSMETFRSNDMSTSSPNEIVHSVRSNHL